ncbi:hypothetical protein PR202_ga31546 [Eleusine coracana subsp. coracana]|uniref:Uncharacterized protein n=1 Tax=Eleusine coracana subsp. coracana TaxID=191504 RepID=A0AAV5DRS2_ELECO|nr:hypothetical protein PR202_ga31546 [Eleusine coracana subsp. coracana]
MGHIAEGLSSLWQWHQAVSDQYHKGGGVEGFGPIGADLQGRSRHDSKPRPRFHAELHRRKWQLDDRREGVQASAGALAHAR